MRVQLDPDALAVARHRHRRSADAPSQRANVNLPTGTLWGSKQAFTVQSNGQLFNAAAFRPLIVAYRNGTPVRLEELGRRHRQRRERQELRAGSMDTRSIVLAIQRQPGTNTIEVVDGIRKLLPQFRAQMPPSVKLDDPLRPLASRSANRSHDVKFTLLLTICLVVMVIFLFLRNISATVIPEPGACRCPSWARSRSCICSAIPSTISR